MEKQKMRWGYITEGRNKPPAPLSLDVKTHCHALITGSSGSGKSFALLYLSGCVLQDIPKIDLYFCDFKNGDFAFLKGYSHYYGGNDCYEGVMEYYESFCNARITGKAIRRHILIFDEYPAFINYLSTKDKQEKTKKAGDILSAISEILMLGRGTACGFGVYLSTQRADATLFANGARDNFMVVLGLGRMSKEQKGMIFAGEEIPNKIYHQGEGCLLADGHPLYEITIPKIRNVIDWKKHIKAVLMENSK